MKEESMKEMECYSTQNHLKECESCRKGWKEIEEEFRKKFGFMFSGTIHEELKEDILAFFKPYFQERLHKEAIEELEQCNGNPCICSKLMEKIK